MLRYGLILFDPGCVRNPQDMIYYFSAKHFPAHKKQAALRDIVSVKTGRSRVGGPELCV